MENSERKLAQVVVFSKEKYDGEWPPEDAAGFLAWLQEKLSKIPPEHMASAKVEIDSASSYEDSHYASLEITYWRPETDEEMAWRQEEIRRQEEMRRARDLDLLAHLKARYERG